ncbi:maleylpyruvate isomerase family mycothiol-dependent enzyme [Streptomyces sp. NPDC048636]|uniref:maleylpyruvate isomerase family mycothiol-dependent enzyme n=1 Tax=Streptomyces sp. NPDC048636 TaxID=3155762 RepID=UPI00342D0FE2
MEALSGQDLGDPWPAGLNAAIRSTAEDIATVLREAADTTVRVPGSQWSVGEAAAHLALANELMAHLAEGKERPYGDGTPTGLAEANEAALSAFAERGAEPLAAMIVKQAEAFLDAAARPGPRGELATPMGPMSVETLGSYLLTHMLGHGYDLARALDRPHMVTPARVELTVPFLLMAMPRVLNTAVTTGFTARYTIRLRGGTRFGTTFTNGIAAVGPQPPSRPDCTILTEPVAFLLMALGRLGPWHALARGGVLAWGRKPWLAPRFPALFSPP